MADLATRVASVDPYLLINYLIAAGWEQVGHRTGMYVRLAWPPRFRDRSASLVVPLDKSMADYPDLMRGALLELDDAEFAGRMAAKVLAALGDAGESEDNRG